MQGIEWIAKAWRSKAQTSNGMARKSWEKQWLWMQGVELISKGKASLGNAKQRQRIETIGQGIE